MRICRVVTRTMHGRRFFLLELHSNDQHHRYIPRSALTICSTISVVTLVAAPLTGRSTDPYLRISAMEPRTEEYKGRRIEIRAVSNKVFTPQLEQPEGEPQVQLVIDEQEVPYGRLPGGQYFLHDYAYDWRDDLIDLACGFIDHQEMAPAADNTSSGGK